MNCPKCSAEMKLEVFEGTEIDRCAACKGALFEAGELERLLAERMGAPADLSATGELSRKLDKQPARCARCDLEMEQFKGPSKLNVDRCPKCLSVFLDQGELGVLLAAGRLSV